jgi:hypothetical protein
MAPPTAGPAGVVTREITEFWHNAAMAALAKNEDRIDTHSLIEIFHELVNESDRRLTLKLPGPLRLQSTGVIGVVFFSDRLVVHIGLLSQFLGWPRETLGNILCGDDFYGSPLSCKQFSSLQAGAQIRGSKFDWHVFRYPRLAATQNLLSRIRAGGGESFYLGTNSMQGPAPVLVRLTQSAFESLTIPPAGNRRMQLAGQGMADILMQYPADRPTGKCWLLYANDDE